MLTLIKKTILSFIIIFLTCPISIAAEQPLTFFGVRSAGMGCVGVADIYTETPLYTNPSVLSYGNGWKFNIINGTLSIGSDLVSKYSSWNDALKKNTTTEKINAISALIPTRFDLGLGTYPFILSNYTTKNFGFGIYGDAKVSSAIINPLVPKFNGSVIGNGTANLGYSYLFNNNISIGGNLKYIYRVATYNPADQTNSIEISVSDILNNQAQYSYYKAGGIGFDLGAMGRFETFAGNTAVGLVLNNVAANLNGTLTNNGNQSNFSTTLPMLTTIGFSVSPHTKAPFGLLDDTLLEADYSMGIPKAEFFRSLHLGAEKKIGGLYLRGGLNESYITGGFGFNLGNIKIDYAYFTQEGGLTLGSSPSHIHMLSGSINIEERKQAPTTSMEAVPSAEVKPIIEKHLVQLKTFSDVPKNYWACQSIEFLATLGVINGFPNGEFKPESNITRVQLVSMLVKAKNIEVPKIKNISFKDVKQNSWSIPYIKAAVNHGWVKGYGNNEFKPDKPVTRAEAAKIICNFAKLEIPNPESVNNTAYPDVPKNYWASGSIAALKNHGLLEFVGENFYPKNNLTRAEACLIISKTPSVKERIDKELYR